MLPQGIAVRDGLQLRLARLYFVETGCFRSKEKGANVELKNIIPWGRNFAEYRAMFRLTDADLASSILGVGDGPASFNAEAAAHGAKGILSVDPLYAHSRKEIEARIDECFDHVVSEVDRCIDNYSWKYFPSPEQLIEARRAAMRCFLSDYEAGISAGRYLAAGLPNLPFPDRAFSLALCSHFLFLYSGHLTLEFHQNALHEMLRAADEVRIFPLLDLNCTRSVYVDPVRHALDQAGFLTEEILVPYEIQKGGNTMLRILRPTSGYAFPAST